MSGAAPEAASFQEAGGEEAASAANDGGGTGGAGVELLGEALAGVSLGGTATHHHSPNPADNAFFNGGGTGGGTNASAQEAASGWGNFTDVSAGADSAFGGSGSSGQDAAAATADAHTESIQLFLSRDPSQTLGDDVFKLSHPNLSSMGGSSNNNSSDEATNNNNSNASSAFRLNGHHGLNSGAAGGGISESASKSSTTGNAYGGAGGTGTGGGGATDARGGAGGSNNRGGGGQSPSSAVTAGTTSSSRSGSPPYNNGSSGVAAVDPAMGSIQAFSPYDASAPNPHAPEYFGVPPPSSPAYSAATTAASTASPYHNKTSTSSNSSSTKPYAGGGDFIAAPAQPLAAPPLDQAQPGQVLYMAVPSPDGRGQVLQPVQMVQLPGSKQMAYVVAGPAGMPPPVVPPPDAADPYNASNTGLGTIGGMLDHRSNNGVSRDMTGSPYAGAPLPPPDNSNNLSRQYGNETRPSATATAEDYSRNNLNGSSSSQFHADPAIASLYASPQRPPLDALLGQVRRLSRDQVGCRLVQQALDEEGPMAASLILQEGLPFWGEAMVDPFGNYLFQKILEKVTAQERVMLVQSVSTRLVNASLNLHGTRSVQKVVELCATDEQQQGGAAAGSNGGTEEPSQSAADILTQALAPAAARLCIDSHGNHVIQRIILKLGPKHSEFVFDAVAASVGDVARHRHGCCVIQRCLDSPPSEARSHLVHRIVEKALELMQDAYGNYVVQYVLDVCSDDDVHAVCESVVGKVNLLAIQKFSSNVMEKCLERCSERVKECYMKEMSDPDRIRELMMDPFGNYVVQRALSVATHAQAVRLVEAMRPHLTATTAQGIRNGGVRNTAGGRRIIAKICRRFPNFSLTTGEATGQQVVPQDLYRRNPVPHHHGGHHPHGGGHHHGGHHGHDELYSRNKGRYPPQQQPPQQQQQLLGSYAPPSAVVGPPLQPQQQLWKAPEQPRGFVGAPTTPNQASPSSSYYNPLLGGSPYYDPFGNTNNLGGGGGGAFHGM